MKEFIEKLIGRLEELKTFKLNLADAMSELMKKDRLDNYISKEEVVEIIKELAEEYKADKVNQLAMMYAQNMHMYGVDVTKAWETATSQSAALNEAYLRGLHDERKYQHTQMKNNNGWIPCSERLPEESGMYLCTIDDKDCPIIVAMWLAEVKMWSFRDPYPVEFIAWQPLPGKYIPKGEQ